MKKLILTVCALATVAAAMALPKAMYVVKGDKYVKYAFGVSGTMSFSDNGTRLYLPGYEEAVNLSEIDYITFEAPIDRTALTSAQQKERLVQIGEEVYKRFNVNDYADMIRCLDVFIRKYYNFYIDPKYYDLHSHKGNPAFAAVKAIGGIAKGNVSQARSLKRAAAELWQCADYYGVFKANNATATWDRVADADYLELQFTGNNGENYSARFTTSSNYVDWSTIDFTGRVPASMILVLRMGDEMIGKAAFVNKANQAEKTFDMDMTVDINNLRVVNNLKTNNSQINDRVMVDINSKRVVDVDSHVNGRHLTSYEEWKDDLENSGGGFDEYGYWIDGPDRDSTMVARLSSAYANVDVLGKLQLKGRMASLPHVYDTLSKETYTEEYRYDAAKGVADVYYSHPEDFQPWVRVLSDYSDCAFYYDGKPEVQGYIVWDVDEDMYSYTSNYYPDVTGSYQYSETAVLINTYDYYVAPVLMFADMSSVMLGNEESVGGFFNSRDFAKLIDDYNEIIDTYWTVSGNVRNPW